MIRCCSQHSIYHNQVSHGFFPASVVYWPWPTNIIHSTILFFFLGHEVYIKHKHVVSGVLPAGNILWCHSGQPYFLWRYSSENICGLSSTAMFDSLENKWNTQLLVHILFCGRVWFSVLFPCLSEYLI